MDRVVEMGQREIGFEANFSSAPQVTKGFWQACEDLQLDAVYALAPVTENWGVKKPARVISGRDIAQKLQSRDGLPSYSI